MLKFMATNNISMRKNYNPCLLIQCVCATTIESRQTLPHYGR